MKKFLISLFLLMMIFKSFAQSSNCYITAAFNYGVFTERVNNVETKLKAYGFDVSISSYFNNTWGIYLNLNYNIPDSATVSSGNISITTTKSDWDSSSLASIIIGPTITFDLSDIYELYSNIGFHMAIYSLSTKYTGTTNFSFGLGGDLGIRRLLKNNLYFTGGCLLSIDFSCNGEISTAYGKTKTSSDDYDLSSIRPYIGIGLYY